MFIPEKKLQKVIEEENMRKTKTKKKEVTKIITVELTFIDSEDEIVDDKELAEDMKIWLRPDKLDIKNVKTFIRD